MKIYTLIENTSIESGLVSEHGLSLYIETDKHKILFDTGQTGAFADNAVRMGVDLTQVDIAVLSHGHYDHGGGLRRFLEINDTAKVYINENAFMPYYNGTEKYIGLDEELLSSNRFVMTQDKLWIDDEISLETCNKRKLTNPINSFGLNMMQDSKLLPDEFKHEQYMLINDGGKRILFSACSHKGVVNIINWFEPDVFVGGFHFTKLNPEDSEGRQCLESTAKQLLEYPVTYYTGHCTGLPQYEFMKKIMGERLNYLSTGTYTLLAE